MARVTSAQRVFGATFGGSTIPIGADLSSKRYKSLEVRGGDSRLKHAVPPSGDPPPVPVPPVPVPPVPPALPPVPAPPTPPTPAPPAPVPAPPVPVPPVPIPPVPLLPFPIHRCPCRRRPSFRPPSSRSRSRWWIRRVRRRSRRYLPRRSAWVSHPTIPEGSTDRFCFRMLRGA